MKIGRFLALLLAMTFLGTILGAASGALLGAAVPGEVTLHGEASGSGSREEMGEPGSVTVGGTADRPTWVSGAALGGGFGVMAGVGAGLALGVLDQILLAIRERKDRTETS